MSLQVDFLNSNTIDNINTNFQRINEVLEEALSRSGELPNHMTSDLDMDSNDILNVNTIQAREFIVIDDPSFGVRGWSPVLAAVTYQGEVIMQLVDYVGGSGNKPTNFIGWYIGSEGYVEDPSDATIFGGAMIPDGDKGDITVSGGGAQWTSNLPRSYPTLTTEERLKDLEVNDTLPSGGFDGVRTPEQELLDNYAMTIDVEPQAATDLGKVMMVPPSEEATSFIAPTIPWLTHRGLTFRSVPLDIRTILHNTPVGLPLFRPIKTNAWGWLVWQYIGEEPLHVLLEGSMNVAIRVSGTLPDAWTRMLLSIRSWDYPTLEAGQNNGRRHLATSVGNLVTPTKFFDYEEFNDLNGDINQDFIDNANTWPELYNGYVNGYFLAGDTTEALRTTDGQGPISSDVRTTNWMDVSVYDNTERSYLMNMTGISSIGRMQYKDSDGNINTFNPMGIARTSRRIWRVPPQAKQIRIYYSGRGDTATNISFRPLGSDASAEADPVKGYWATREFNVKRDVVFWPGASYSLEFYTETFEGANAREWGHRPQGGGLSFDFDAGPIRRKLSTKLFRRS